MLGLLSRLDRSEFEPLVVAPHKGPLNDSIAALGIPVVVRSIAHWIATGDEVKLNHFQIGRNFLAGLKSRVWALAHQIEHNQIDVVYTNTVVSIEGALAARLTRRPHIWHLREQVPGNSQLKSLVPSSLIPQIVGRFSDRVIVNSHYLGKAYDSNQTRNKTQVIYNGIDPASFNLDPADSAYSLRMELGLAAPSQLVVLIGSIIPRKGQMLLAEAAALISSRIPSITFLFIGEGEANYISKIKAFSESKGIQKQIRFLGWRHDIPRILAASDLLVVTSDEEPFGRTVIEAMAAGTPVVSTRCGGPEEIVIDECTGLLVPKGDADALAEAIERIIGNTTEAARMSAAGLARLHETFTLEAHAHHVQTTISDVVHNHPYKLHSEEQS
ncbi:MAG: glycosyltransferase family 4 protein [Gammaproteobacteria bacterium]|nr:glycosyltransferase family 4 protein [Gammaproteobacteria bacterium]MBQ0838667.1 glycosyltransferase family 4 protein [Gammaproteobacteria bacterium]